ncbi:MAG: hypothetical protein WCH31_05025 [Actinomycetes bacterium]
MSRNLASVVVFAGAALLLAAASSAASRQALSTCSTKSLVPSSSSGYHVVSVQAQALSCQKARAVATQVASQLIHGKPISVPGVNGFGMSTQTCTGCAPRTEVSLTYPSGAKVTIVVTGPGRSSSPAPAPGSNSGSGTVTL